MRGRRCYDRVVDGLSNLSFFELRILITPFGNDVFSQSIWLNSHIKVNNKSRAPYLKIWIEKDIYIRNYQNKQKIEL
jgi:hypothetical protein